MTTEQEIFLNQYLESSGITDKNHLPAISCSHFCSDEFNANQCAELIKSGIKRATCSLKAAYDLEGEPLPEVGRLLMVLDWNQTPVCIVKITEVSVCRFNEVTAEFAYAEGEGDRSYEWWRAEHIKFFTEYSDSLGIGFTEESELVLERFERVFPIL